MLTLLITILATAYFVVPELLSRFVLNFFLVRKAMSAPKSEELMRGAFWAIFPICGALLTRNLFCCKIPKGTTESFKVVFSCLYDEKFFEKYDSIFFSSLKIFERAHLCLLLRTYLIVIVASVLLGILARNFGYFRELIKEHKFLSKILHWIVLPRISEWHIALSTMLLHKPKQYSIAIDVMTKNGTPYRGGVNEKNIAADGSLQTLMLMSAERFLHANFIRDRTAYAERTQSRVAKSRVANSRTFKKPETIDYWRKIPGELFLLVGSDIVSVNVRHVSTISSVKSKEDEELTTVLKDLTQKLNVLLETQK